MTTTSTTEEIGFYVYRAGYTQYALELKKQRQAAMANGVRGIMIEPKYCNSCKMVVDGDHHCLWVIGYSADYKAGC